MELMRVLLSVPRFLRTVQRDESWGSFLRCKLSLGYTSASTTMSSEELLDLLTKAWRRSLLKMVTYFRENTFSYCTKANTRLRLQKFRSMLMRVWLLRAMFGLMT